jgi:class 3 adenylate cyclase
LVARRSAIADLPTGTVTFLFTDIEGSTSMWERNAEAMQRALARHEEILQSAIEVNSGYVFKTVGDAFCAAFASAPDALEAALSAQRALYAQEWNECCTIRARMALHTGTVEERGGDYFGPPVNRVARLLSAGHGGQTLLSLATQELVRDQLPSGTGMRDLSERRLKDLIRPERIFQLLASLPHSNIHVIFAPEVLRI